MNQFDKIFRNKLEHHTVDVPAGSWENIASQLPQQKKQLRPLVPILFISFGMLVMVGAILVSWYALPDSRTNITQKLNIQSESPIALNLNNSKEQAENINPTGVTENNVITTLKYTVSKNKDLPADNTTLSNEKFITNIKAVKNPISQAKQINGLNLSLNQNVLFNLEDESEHAEKVPESRSLIYVDAIDNKLRNSKFPVHRRIKYAKPFKQNSKPAKACPFVFDTQDKSLDVYFSHDYANKVLQPNGGESQGYLNIRNQTERAMYSYSVGARFGYNLSYRWNLHTGFNYSQINEKFEYTDPESNQTRLITIKDYVYANGKIVDSIITEEIVVVPGTEKLRVYNTFRSFDIPIIARFTLLANKHLSLSATAGVYLNLGFSQRGMIIGDNSNAPIDFTSGKENAEVIFKTQLGVSAYGGVSLAYHLTSNIDFVLEPHVRFQTESMTVGDYALKQNFNTFGVATGLRYKF